MPSSYTKGPNMKTKRSLEQSVIKFDDYTINYYIFLPLDSLIFRDWTPKKLAEITA